MRWWWNDIDLETGHTHDLEYQLTDGAQLATDEMTDDGSTNMCLCIYCSLRHTLSLVDQHMGTARRVADIQVLLLNRQSCSRIADRRRLVLIVLGTTSAADSGPGKPPRISDSRLVKMTLSPELGTCATSGTCFQFQVFYFEILFRVIGFTLLLNAL